MAEHAVLVRISEEDIQLDAIYALEDKPIDLLEGTEIGDMDGHDVAVSGADATIYLYGSDADALFAAVVPILRADPLYQGATAVLRYGEADDKDAREKTIVIDPG